MTVSSSNVPISYTGSGTRGPFSTGFYFLEDSHLLVKVITIATGAEETLELTTDYTVSGAGSPSGGSVTLTVGYGAISSSYKIVIDLAVPYTQETDYQEGDPFPAESHETALDKLTMLAKQNSVLANKSIRIPNDEATTTTLPRAVARANKAVVFDASGNVTVSTDDYEDQAADAAASAAAAASSASSAATSASSSASSASSASTSATSASGSATSAAASAAAAAATLASAVWRDVVFITNSDSPFTVGQTHNGKLIRVDTSSGAVTVNLTQISSLTMPFTVGIKKESSDGNAVTINRGGSDLIDGLTSVSLTAAGQGRTLIADTDSSPDEWTSADFGSGTANITVDVFNGTGAQTAFTLSVDPGTKNNTDVFVGGVYQQKSTYSLSGTTLTFSVAPPSGTSNIEVESKSTAPVGTPSDGSVTTAKIVDNAVTLAKLATQAANTVLANATGSTAVPTAVSVSASKLVGRGSTGNIAEITPNTGLVVSGTNLNVDVGTSASKIVQLDGSAKLPAVDGSQLTNIPSSWVLLSTKTASSSSSLDFTSLMSSSYSSYRLVFEALTTSANAALNFKHSSNNGSTWALSGAYQLDTRTLGGATAPTYSGGSTATIPLLSAPGAAYECGGVMDIVLKTSTGTYGYAKSSLHQGSSDIIRECFIKLDATMNAFQIIPASGNLASGKVYLYGIKNT